ncbi:MAG: tyrosine-type recombinase/integrase [Acidimicrobiales bacterium]
MLVTGQLTLSAHVLRHTFVTNLIRSEADVVLVAEIAGHHRLDTTRRYSLPSQADKDAAVEANHSRGRDSDGNG